MTNTNDRIELEPGACATAYEFLDDRREWLEIALMPVGQDGGLDIVLKLDGTYFGEGGHASAVEVARTFARDLRALGLVSREHERQWENRAQNTYGGAQ